MSKIVVITGGTRGIGFGLVREFLKRDCKVVFYGRSQVNTDKALAQLTTEFGADKVLGTPCDISDGAQLQALWDAAVERFGRVDIWINNAGIGNRMRPVWEVDEAELRDVIDTNLTGSMLAARVEFTGEAVNIMTLASRMVLANMAAEMGGKCASADPLEVMK